MERLKSPKSCVNTLVAMLSNKTRVKKPGASWVILLSLLSTLGCTKSQLPPKLEIEPLEIDLGKIYGGEIKHLSFPFKNSGGDTLTIEEVEPSCSCMTLKHTPQFILPSETDTLSVEFNSDRFRGQIQKHIDVFTNEAEMGFKRITINAEVLQEWKLKDFFLNLNFGRLEQGKTYLKHVSIQNTTNDTIKVEEIFSDSQEAKIELTPKSVKSQEKFTFRVKLTPNNVGFFRKNIYVKTSSIHQPRFSIKLTYSVK